MIKQNQLVFKQFLSDVEDWCLEILTSNQGGKEDFRNSWLAEVRGILKRVQHTQEQQYLYESDILDIKRCVEETAEGMRNVSERRVNNEIGRAHV